MLSFARLITTFFGLGYLAGAGTWASIAIMLLAYFFLPESNLLGRIIIALTATAILWYLTEILRAKHDYQDPPFIVADEMAATLLLAALLPTNLWVYLVAFFVFRLFDITKWGGIYLLEKWPKTLGIMADDFAAAGYAYIIAILFNLLIQ